MPEVSIPEHYCQIQLHWSGLSPSGSAPMNSWGFGVSIGWNLDDFVAGVQEWMQRLINPQSEQWGANFVRFVVGAAGTPPYAFFDTSIVGASGTDSGGAAPPSVSALIAWSTAIPGRSGRGRTYLPGVPVDKVFSTGELTPAYASAVSAAVLDWGSHASDVGLGQRCLLHPVGSPLADDPSTVVTYAVRGEAATQRRRMRG